VILQTNFEAAKSKCDNELINLLTNPEMETKYLEYGTAQISQRSKEWFDLRLGGLQLKLTTC
jgi:hypothetical protein